MGNEDKDKRRCMMMMMIMMMMIKKRMNIKNNMSKEMKIKRNNDIFLIGVRL